MLLIPRIVAGNDRARALSGIDFEWLTTAFLKIEIRLVKNRISFTQ
jgi:hypothetical protein